MLLSLLYDERELRVFNKTDRSRFPDDISGLMLYCITNNRMFGNEKNTNCSVEESQTKL